MTTSSNNKKNEDNLAIYRQVENVPAEAIKPIGAGRLKGMSDINPMWRIKIMTQTFGPVGVGWKYTIDKQWTEQYGDEVKCYCNVSVYVKTTEGVWSDAIPGTGGSSAVAIERNGAYVNDESYKMALTDALSVAMKSLGVGASVYFGKDADYGTKYECRQGTSQQSPQQDAQSLLAQARAEAANVKSREEMSAWWAKYPSLQQTSEMLAVAKQLGQKYPKNS